MRTSGALPALTVGLGVCLGLGTLLITPVRVAADKGKMSVERVEYKGWKNNLRLSNGETELVITLDVGPRIISYSLKGGKNVFKNYDDQMGKSGEADWQIRGGHRLWIGPEDLTRTYALDNRPVQFKELDGAVRLIPPADSEYGVQKEMDVRLEPAGSKVSVIHRIRNVGAETASLAPWALTVLAPGGVEVIPLPEKKPHPGPPSNARSPKDYAPNQLMSVWPFFDFKDTRWSFGSKYITLRQEAGKGPTKIGLAHQLGWAAYWNDGTVFVKRFDYEDGKQYPDGGVNFETFTNPDMLECETLGPIVKLEPGKLVEMTERWELVGDVPEFKDEAGIDQHLRSKIKNP